MQDLVERGRLRMSRMSAYVSHESPVIGDRNEGLRARYSADNPSLKVTIHLDGKSLDMPGTSITINDPTRKHGMFCMCRLEPVREGSKLNLYETLAPVLHDPRMREFGDTLVLFRDSVEFLRRVEAAAANVGHELAHSPVEYVAGDHCGDMGPFRKLDNYSYQREWRCLTAAPIEDAVLWLDTGPTLDIAHWVDLQTVPIDPRADGAHATGPDATRTPTRQP